MTTEEPFERIEPITAGLAEERRKDREESRQLWRNTQHQIHELSIRMNDLTLKVAETNDTVARLAEESHAADQALGQRIERLVSVIAAKL